MKTIQVSITKKLFTQCEGCNNLFKFSLGECKFTYRGVKILENCPCTECLIKTTCTVPCCLILDHKQVDKSVIPLIREMIRKS